MSTRRIVTVTVGDVTIRAEKPSAEAVQRNIEAGQAALLRAKEALITPGIRLQRKKGVPLYFGCEDSPGLMIRELNGIRTTGKFSGGRFRPVKQGKRKQ